MFFVIYKNKIERYKTIYGLSYGKYNYNLSGTYPYSNNDFKNIQCRYYSDPKNMIRVNRHRMETKLPVLTKHRLDYNDKRMYDRQWISNTRVLPGKARLKELPLDLKNLWHATVLI